MGKNQHVTPRQDGKWNIKGENNQKATKVANTQAEAIKIAKEIAKNQKSELLIHGKDNLIRERESYSNDPFPPKDKN